MDLRRLRAGEWVYGIGSLLLLVSLFLTWYDGKNVEVRSFEPVGDFDLTAWEVFAAMDVILAAGALGGLAMVAISATQRVSAVNIAGSSLLVLASVVLLALVLFRLARIPDYEVGGVVFFDSSRGTGLWLALVGCLGMLGGGLAAIRDERITGDTLSVDPATIETLPAPQVGP